MTEKDLNSRPTAEMVVTWQKNHWKKMACLHLKSFETFLSGLVDNNLAEFVSLARKSNDLAADVSNITIQPQTDDNLQQGDQRQEQAENKFDFFKHYLLQALLNSAHTTDYIYNVDIKPLSFLENILIKKGPQTEDESIRLLTIEFHFKPNPFFKNEILMLDVKANFGMVERETFEIPSFPRFEFVKGSNIEFYENMDFRQVMDTRRLRGYYQVVEIRKESFFDVFQMFDVGTSFPNSILEKRALVFNCFVNNLLVKFLPNILYFALPQKDSGNSEGSEDYDDRDEHSHHSHTSSGSLTDRYADKETSFTDENDNESAD